MHVKLGNVAPVEVVTGDDGQTERNALPGGHSVTEIHVPNDTSLSEAFVTITSAQGVWAYHSEQSPAWVEADDESLQTLLASHFGCPAGAPEGGIDAWTGTPEAAPEKDAE
jgi:hypothetical protein